MIVKIGADRRVTLEDPTNFKKFHLECSGSPADLDACRAALAPVGQLESAEVAWIYTRALADWAPHGSDPAYRQGLDAMLAFASSKGWMRDDIGAVRAHVVWTG